MVEICFAAITLFEFFNLRAASVTHSFMHDIDKKWINFSILGIFSIIDIRCVKKRKSKSKMKVNKVSADYCWVPTEISWDWLRICIRRLKCSVTQTTFLFLISLCTFPYPFCNMHQKAETPKTKSWSLNKWLLWALLRFSNSRSHLKNVLGRIAFKCLGKFTCQEVVAS